MKNNLIGIARIGVDVDESACPDDRDGVDESARVEQSTADQGGRFMRQDWDVDSWLRMSSR